MARNPHLDDILTGGGVENIAERRYVPQVEEYDRSFSTQDQADRFDYGHAQMWNRPGDPINRPNENVVGPWLHRDSDVLNPSVFERQKGLASFPGAGKRFAELYNEGFPNVWNPKDIRNILGWGNQLGNPVDSPVDEYGYNLSGVKGYPDMWKSKREQVKDEENTFVADMMDLYGRDNPLLQELSRTTPNKSIFMDEGYQARELDDMRYLYQSNLDSPVDEYGKMAGMDDSLQSLIQQMEELDPDHPNYDDRLELLQSDMDMNYPWAT